VIVIGSSTGGVQALEAVFTCLPAEIPPIVVVQHIPAVFSAALARRLNDLCPFEVKEAVDGDEVLRNRILIAPGGMQLKLVRGQGGLRVSVFDGPPVNRHKPSVDVMFDSVATLLGGQAVGVILTGMGADGAKGLLRMRKAGARTIAQDKDSCIVFGMPREAIALGAAEQVRALPEIPAAILSCLSRRKAG
jgi:two-component system chemotaxis response regulator CheB